MISSLMNELGLKFLQLMQMDANVDLLEDLEVGVVRNPR